MLISNGDTIQEIKIPVILKINNNRGLIQWQQSVDSIFWVDIKHANFDSLLIMNIDSTGYYRAKITDGTCYPVYSDILFVVDGDIPKILTKSLINITSSSAFCNGQIIDNGNQEIIEKGFVWDTNPNPTISNNKVIVTKTGDEFEASIVGLEKSKTYYIRAYCSNIMGVAYGEEKIFSTYSENLACQDVQDCCTMKYAHIAIEFVDYTDVKFKLLHDFLFELDRKYAYHVFTRNPHDFLMWCQMINTEDITSWDALGGAVHETNHMINSDLIKCNPALKQKYLSFDNIYETNLSFGQTANISIVEKKIADNLKFHSRYKTYIEGARNSNGNDFRVLIDELNSYTGGAWFDLQYFKSGFLPEIQGHIINDGGLGGMVNFMVYLEYYFMAARVNYPETYQEIQTQTNLLKLIQDLWVKAEEILEMSYSYSTISGTNSSYRMSVDLAYINAVFSSELLQELDKVGIKYKPVSYWSNTYLKK